MSNGNITLNPGEFPPKKIFKPIFRVVNGQLIQVVKKGNKGNTSLSGIHRIIDEMDPKHYEINRFEKIERNPSNLMQEGRFISGECNYNPFKELRLQYNNS